MRNWLRNKLHNFIFSTKESNKLAATTSRDDSRIASRGMNFTIHPASGGYILEYSSYDQKTDDHNYTLHIIGADQDLGQGIAHVITLELLRK